MPAEQCIRKDTSAKTGRLRFDLAKANRELARLSPLGRIEWANSKFGGNLILPASFGPTSPILLKMATDIIPDITVVTICHGHETPRTLELMDWYKGKLDLDLRVYDAPRLRVPREGSAEFERFKRQIKTEPFQQILDDFQSHAYLSGVISWQTSERQKRCFIEDKGSVLAIHPLLDMSEENAEKFFLATGLPRNEDYYDPAKGVHQSGECGLHTATYH